MDTDNNRKERKRQVVRNTRCRATACYGSAMEGYMSVDFFVGSGPLLGEEA